MWAVESDPVSNTPLEPVTSFPAGAPRITASAPVRMLSAGTTIAANWAYNDTPLEAFSREVIFSAEADQIWISFHLDRDPETLWPAGTYEISISRNGVEVQRAQVDVVVQE